MNVDDFVLRDYFVRLSRLRHQKQEVVPETLPSLSFLVGLELASNASLVSMKVLPPVGRVPASQYQEDCLERETGE